MGALLGNGTSTIAEDRPVHALHGPAICMLLVNNKKIKA